MVHADLIVNGLLPPGRERRYQPAYFDDDLRWGLIDALASEGGDDWVVKAYLADYETALQEATELNDSYHHFAPNNKMVILDGYQCGGCGHVWLPRVKEQAPKVCPACKSHHWNR